jgi:hypothetical protein
VVLAVVATLTAQIPQEQPIKVLLAAQVVATKAVVVVVLEASVRLSVQMLPVDRVFLLPLRVLR